MSADHPSRPGRVLLIDDEPAIRDLVAMALRRAGLDVVTASGGPEGLALLNDSSVDVLVSDMGMPGMNGLDVVRALRARSDTLTLPIILITGSGDEHSVIDGLEAGANDFLSKPVRLDELVARVKAQIRSQAAWASTLQDELKTRSEVIARLGDLSLPDDPEEASAIVVGEFARQIGAAFVAVSQVAADGRMSELSTFDPEHGVRRGGDEFSSDLAGYLQGRAREGPWVDEVGGVGMAEPSFALRRASPDLVASAPIYVRGVLVALITIGMKRDARAGQDQRRRMLASVIDYAAVLELLAARAMTSRSTVAADRARLEAMLNARDATILVQPIVKLADGEIVGYEALTRFADGTRPDIRFSEAWAAGLGAAFELASVRLAVAAAALLPSDRFLSVNLSPGAIVGESAAIRDLVAAANRPVVIEITEHIRIDDYPALRAALVAIGPDVQIAVDDAGAGFASLRHLLELEADFAKLDMSLVRAISTDRPRQSMVAGLDYYAARTGCHLIAEGVETEAEAETLRDIGVELGQGYLFARPAPPENFAQRL